MRLYGYWRSSSAYRVRIALNLKGLEYEQVPVHLVRGGGEQHGVTYTRVNPQGLVPALEHEGEILTQSLAIIEYIEQVFPAPPLLPADAGGRARVRAMAQLIACEIQPLNNLRVLQYLERELRVAADARERWYCHWLARGFAALENMVGHDGRYCHDDRPGLADVVLVPQVYNAERFGCDMTPYPRLRAIVSRCLELPAFDAARPEKQPDAD